MKAFFVILICRILKWIGGILGRGSSLPGQIALRLDKNILRKIRLPKYVIAVTGSNGKTSTVEMIARILQQGGKNVAWNKEGSNQIEGVTTLILASCSLFGRMRKDILLIETDERYARYTFRYFTPTHYVITNLYRDQLTRNGHPEWVYAALQDSIHENTQLILNADDPLVSLFGRNRKDTVWFGVDRYGGSTQEPHGMYKDGAYCPACKEKMKYDYYHYNHIGSYHCPSCGHRKHPTAFTVTDVDLEKGEIVIDNTSVIALSLHSIYNVYNLLAAYAVCALAGIERNLIADSIQHYALKNGRVVNFRMGAHAGTLLTSKHENSVSYDQSLRLVSQCKTPYSAMIIVDAVSRKYFTSEISWLWDIDFSQLRTNTLQRVMLCGTYANDLAVRFFFTDIPQEKIVVEEDIGKAVDAFVQHGNEPVFAITCFSDKDKLLGRVTVL